jgi:hypothetical protein
MSAREDKSETNRYSKWMRQLSSAREIPVRWQGMPGQSDGVCNWGGLDDPPRHGGVYAIWWNASDSEAFVKKSVGKTLHFSGPQGHGEIPLKITRQHFTRQTNGMIPLYVGKSFGSISKRIGQHLCLGSARMVEQSACGRVTPRKRTTCQVRDRLDRLYPELDDTRSLIASLRISWVELCGVSHFADRFYLEDLAVGLWRPLFNLDTER